MTPRGILVIIVARIGDTLLVTPTLRALKLAWPEAQITVAAHPKRLPLFDGLPFIDALKPIDKKRAPFLGHLPGKPYDLALVYGHDKPLLNYALRVSQRVSAFCQNASALDDRLDPCVPAPTQLMHAVEERALLLTRLGQPLRNRRLDYRASARETSAAKRWLEDQGINPGHHQLYGLQPSSFPSKAYRDWPAAHFKAIGQRLLDRDPTARLVILGGPEGKTGAEALARHFGDFAVCAAGLFGLRESFALMALLDFYLGVDTGPTHIAGALGLPMVGLYHCQHPGRYLQPLDHPRGRFLEHPLTGGDCDRQSNMADIDVDTVWQAVTDILDDTETA